MPTYEYECRSCGYRFEKFQSMSAEPLKKCPKCGKNSLYRLIGLGAGIIFKGSGFYITDYKKSGSQKDNSTGSKSTETNKKQDNSKSSSKGSTNGS